MSSKREINIEALRLILMLMIVMLHVFTVGIKNSTDQHSYLFFLELLLTSFFVVGVNCFVFISGFYGIHFKLKSLVTLLLQCLFYSISILIIFMALGYNIKSINILKAFLPISGGVWWFMSTYVALYIISPIINASFKVLSKNQAITILVGLLILNTVSSFIFDNTYIGSNGYSVFNFITIYYLARCINVYDIKLKYPVFAYVISSLLIFFINAVLCYLTNKTLLPALRYSNPLLLLSATSLFFIFKNIRFSDKFNIIYKLAPLSLGVYLIHNHNLVWTELVLVIMKIRSLYSESPFLLITLLFLFSFSVFILCLFIEKLRQIICKPIIQFLFNKVGLLKAEP